jgi:hypothetical protein
VRKINNGDTIKAKTHAEIERIANLSIIGVENLGRANPEERIEALGILALFGRPIWMPLQVNREDRAYRMRADGFGDAGMKTSLLTGMLEAPAAIEWSTISREKRHLDFTHQKEN